MAPAHRGQRAALEDGSVTALRTFLGNRQYSARNTDERAAATALFNDGGPEVKAAAEIALNAPADELHTFVQAGQFMADRKDQLAYTHIAQVQRLIAEGDMIAAKARENAHRAAQAAFIANDAAADAENSRIAAEQSAKDAEGYATQADAAADSTEVSAAQAKSSATTARNAANRATQDAINAEESAAEAEFSAQYARGSAAAARESAEDALDAAIAAGKSNDAADADAKAAWKEFSRSVKTSSRKQGGLPQESVRRSGKVRPCPTWSV
ncbi:hypothetical protein ACFWM7_33960 [Streptomyces sp. NPDC058375]|uniref:ALF repeat-containing protein n=1 Tax=Streptomyces sp. NPDC058375 TaxID=3346467 RepID=UPI00365E1F20